MLLFLLDLFPRGKDKRFSIKSLPDVFMKHIRAGAVNILIIFASVTLCFVLFHELFSKSASLYRTLGIVLVLTEYRMVLTEYRNGFERLLDSFDTVLDSFYRVSDCF